MTMNTLLSPWTGPLGGLPPFDLATPEALEAACREAIALKRAEVQAIAASAEAPDFANTVEALERSGRELQRASVLLRLRGAALSTGEMPAVIQRITPLLAGLEDEILFDQRLFARIDAVHRTRDALPPMARRLTEVIHRRFVRAGVGLPTEQQQRLAQLNARIQTLCAQYNQNLIADGDEQLVWVERASQLDGLAPSQIAAGKTVAERRGRPDAWAIGNARAAVWPVLTHARDRGLREQVWRMWNGRGNHAGPRDNKPVAAEILRLRGEKARLLGHASYAHLAIDERMARRPETAMALLMRTWHVVHATALKQLDQYAAIAREEDGLQDALQPWDRQFYAERVRRRDFGLDGEVLRHYLTLDGVLAAMFDSAARTYGLSFHALPDAPRLHQSVRVYEVRRDGEGQGVLYFDLFNRPGKMHGSYQTEYRTAAVVDGQRVLPISAVHSSFEAGTDESITLPFEYANVFFHEFGHALHMLLSRAPYPSLGSVGVPWDFVEVPALLNERWLLDRGTLARFARHAQTGEAVPEELIDKLERSLRHDRVFSLNLDYLAPAIVDLAMHLQADGEPGREIDVAALEAQTLGELDMPPAWDLIMRVTNNVHSFPGGYAAGLYGYLWADVMAADAAEAFLAAPGGLNDGATGRRWEEALLGAAWTVEPDEAWRRFRGRDVDPAALLRRFGLESPKTPG